MFPRLFTLALVGFAFAISVRAASESSPQRVSHELSEVLYDEPGDGALYAVGRGWKARFDCDGASFIPFLGSDAPRDEIVRFELREVSVDGVALEIGSNAGATRSGNTITYARESVDEIYTASLDSLEHVVVVRDLPRRGEVVVRCAITTDLAACNVNDAVEFRSERGGVRYSNAIALDARGKRCALAARFEDGEIVLRVPSEMARDAELPLTIDPLIQVFGVATTTADELAPDAAALGGPQVGRRAEVWETVWSQTDHDVTMRATSFGGVMALFLIDATTEYWTGPKVASQIGAKPYYASFECVATAGLPSSASRRIVGRLNFAYSALAAPVTLATGMVRSPDVGGDPVFGLNSYLVVWERESANGDHDIVGAQLDTSGSGVSPRDFAVDPLQDDTRPAISKTNSVGFAGWGVVWERRASATNHDIWFSTYDYATITAPIAISSAIEDETRPTVSSFDGTSRYVVAYERDLGGQHDVMLRVVNGGSVGAAVDLAQLEGGSHASLDQARPSIDGDATGYLVAYKESDALETGLYHTRLTSFAVNASNQIQLHESRIPLGFPTTPRTRANVSSDAAQIGGSVPEFEVVWDEPGFSPDHGVNGAYFVDGASAGTVVASCFGDGSDTPCPCAMNGGAPSGCPNSLHPNGAESSWTGEARVGADSFLVHTTRLPLNAVALLVQATAHATPAVVFGDGLRCLDGTQTRIAVRTANASGDLSYPSSLTDPAISITGGVPASGGLRVYQLVYRDPANFCGASTWNTANALRVSWAP